MPQRIKLRVNGRIHYTSAEPETPLIYVLRNDLKLKGTKFGCGLEQCGACMVLIDGDAIPSCRIPVRSAQGHEITTVEGIGTEQAPHPLQTAFIEEGAVQCGFCTPGMIIAAKALLDRNPHPSDVEIRAELAANLCRCGIYDRFLRAVERAAGRPEPLPQYTTEHNTKLKFPAPKESQPGSLAQTPGLDSWVRIDKDGTITLFTGKVELGQDIRTSIAMIGAEELDVSLERIRVVSGDTAQTPDEGYTVSSRSLETSGNALRMATAEVKRIALLVAHEELEAPIERLVVVDGAFTDPETGHSVTYWDLFAGKKFGASATCTTQPKKPAEYRIVGRQAQRLDLLTKVTGGPCFVHDLDLAGMVHGRVIRPPTYDARLDSVDERTASKMAGVIQIVRDGSFLGVVAEREEQAVRAAEILGKSATWTGGRILPDQESFSDYLLNQPDQAFLIVEGKPVEGPVPAIEAPPDAVQTLGATYYRPYHMHASQGPSAAVAQLADGKLTVWTHSQGVYPLRSALAQVLRMAEEKIRTIHVDGPGCFGHNGADDAALDAALLARVVPGRPVSLKWSRSDEHRWEPYGATMTIQMQASLNAEGRVVDWNHDVWGFTQTGRAAPVGDQSPLLGAWHLAEPFRQPQAQPRLMPQMGIHRNADPIYAFSRQRIVKHFLPDSPLRVSALRGLGSYANVFAIESFMDELAHVVSVDPIEFRLRYLADERARAVLQAVAGAAGPPDEELGRGVAFARYKNCQGYVAVAVDLSVNRDSGHIRLVRAVMAADVGQIVNPDGLSSQLEGAFTQSASWTLKEQVSFDENGVTSIDWRSYPILRFREAPEIQTVLLDRPGQPYLGIGEGAQGPVPAAIANAIFQAAGIRLRKIPFTPERVKSALLGK